MPRKKRGFAQSAQENNAAFLSILNRLSNIVLARFSWSNLPDTVDERFLELTLLKEGQAMFFRDDAMGELCLPMAGGGQLDVYRIPTIRRAITSNGYHAERDRNNSVIIWNNLRHTASWPDVYFYARRLWDITRAIDTNIKAQKTPILIRCDESQRLSILNLYKQYEGNEPFLFGDSALSSSPLQVLSTGAPFVADKLETLYNHIFSDAMANFGVDAVLAQKKERLVTAEAEKASGSIEAVRQSDLLARRQAADEINRMFGLNVRVDFGVSVNSPVQQDNDGGAGV